MGVGKCQGALLRAEEFGENWVSVAASLTYFDMRTRGNERREGDEEEKEGEGGGRQDERQEIFMIKIAFCLEMIDYVTQNAQNDMLNSRLTSLFGITTAAVVPITTCPATTLGLCW